jgi:hypothetical protein
MENKRHPEYELLRASEDDREALRMVLVHLTSEISFDLQGFTDKELPLSTIAAATTARILFPAGEFPPLKSNVIAVLRTTSKTPLYAAGTQHELILVNCHEDKPWQFTYQLAHELGHLTARSDLRHPRKDGNLWIEEAICGAYSLYAMRSMSELDGRIGEGAREYLEEETIKAYSSVEVDAEWFAGHYEEFRAAEGLTDNLKKLSGYIAERLPFVEVAMNNRAIRDIPLEQDLTAYLRTWQAACGSRDSLPILLQNLAGPDVLHRS